MNQTLKKIISVFLAFLLLLQVFPVSPAGFAAYTDHITIGDVTLDCYHTVSYDPQKNIYRLNLSLDAELYEQRSSNNSSIPLRNYFTANYTGDYLIQLWGGKGADGMDDSDRLGGDGGAGGYVHGIVHLEKGQTLFYSLGGNGSTTYVTGQGGGANGGGNGGTSISYSVGGGGGYSAIFLFDESEFDKYLDTHGNLTVNNINETDRATKYLMIAGGGGGGGAAPGTALIGSNTRWPAHGGAGGTIDQSISGTIEAVGVTVPGTFYAGFNGSSSGTSDAYIGRGGTTTPGVVSSTVWDWSKGEKPNDWTGSANHESEPGSGGAGNLRGGAGGGGFCGGSGGVQQSLVSPTQVGGGGGGSSFIAATANGHAIETTLDDATKLLLDPLPENIPGGAVSITYLPLHQSHSQANPLDLSAAEDVTVSFTLSKYFNVSFFSAPQLTVEYDGEDPVGYEELTLSNDNGAYKFTISAFDLVPSAENPTGTLDMTFEFTPKAGFAGGNGVPLLKDNKVYVTTAATAGGATQTHQFPLHAEDCSVNVPLSLPLGLGIQSHITYESKTYSATELYRDDYTAIREALKNKTNSDPMYDFIDSIGTHSVGGLTDDAWSATISQTTAVPISLTLTPKATDVISGAGTWNNTKTFTDNATITFLDAHANHINGQILNFTKRLEYNDADGTYTYTLNTKADASSTSSTIPDPVPISDPNLPANEIIYPVPHDGVYLIQVWGANGANGSESRGFSGGEGGDGGYASIYLPLNKGDQLKLMQMGVIGANPIRAGGETSGGGGGGGTYTGVSLYRDSETTPLVIAGGGGGGGNAMSQFWGSGQAGVDGVDVSAGSDSTLSGNLADYNGRAGEPAERIIIGIVGIQPGAGGPAGKNYVSSAFQQPTLSAEGSARLNEASTANPSSGAGHILITCLELTNHGHVDTTLTDYTLDLTFSNYFQIVVPKADSSNLALMFPSPSLNNSATSPNANGFYSILPDTNAPRPITPGTGGFYSILADTNGPNPVPPNSGGFYSISPDTRVIYSIGPPSPSTTSSLDRAVTHTTSPLKSLSGIDSLGGNVVYDSVIPNRVTIPGIKPVVTENTIDFTVVLILKPRTNFLGGNSVPILTAATIAQPLHDDKGNLVLEDGNPIADTQPIPVDSSADFANVAFADSSYTPNLTVIDQHLGNTGETVAVSDLYTWSNEWSGAGYTWEDDYVSPIKTLLQEGGTGENLINASTLGPFSKNTHYDVTVGVVPIHSPVQVGPAMSDITDTQEVSVFVLPRVTYKLDYLTTDVILNPEHNCASLWPDEDHISVLSPVSEGYTLPGSITVTYDEDQTAVPFSYDSATGEIWISAAYATKDLTITASANPRTFSITFAYEDPATGLPITKVEQHRYGAPINVDREEIPVTGYTFVWNWYWRDGKAQTTMPAYDLTVVGIYTPKKYTVRVEYYDENGALMDGDCKPYQKEYDFGSDYSIQTPYRSGYVSSRPIVEGTVNKAAVEALEGGTQIVHKVTYAQSNNTLRVNHVLIGLNGTTGKLDQATLLEATTRSIPTDGSFTVKPLDSYKSGYAIRFVDISGNPLSAQSDGTYTGTMDGDGVEISVIYTPNTYTVTFETDGGVINGEGYTRTVLYGNLYRLRVEGNDPPTYSYVSLPTQVIRRGYSFDGWYLVPDPQAGDERITSDHTVDIAENHTLYAKWVPKEYSITVEYDFADGTEARPTDAYSYGYDEEYIITIPQIPGYTAHLKGDEVTPITQFTGRMPAEFVVRQVIYKPITCTLTVKYAFADGLTGGNLPDLPDPVVQSKTFGETYRVESATLTSKNGKQTYYPSQTVIEGIMDDPNGKTFTVYYYEAEPVISATITWSDLSFTYDRGIWNPSALRYENGSITPNSAGGNEVTVTNNKESNVPILAHFSYQPYDRAPDIAGTFYLDESEVTSVEIAKPSGDTTDSKTVKLQLSGSLPDSLSGTLISGQCVVTITTLTGGG